MEYEVIRKKKRTMSIRIGIDGKIVVSVPTRTSDADIRRFVDGNMKWIEKHIIIAENRAKRFPVLSPAAIRKVKSSAELYFSEMVGKYSRIMNWKPKSVEISYGKKRLGACYPDTRISFSYYLMYFPEEVREYVVVHELAHIKYKNHQKEFYSFVEKYIHDYKNAIRKMKYPSNDTDAK